MKENRFCLMYDGILYNLIPDAFDGTPIIIDVGFGDKLKTFGTREEAEAARLSAYSRRIEYEENGLEIPKSFELISELEVIEIDAACEEFLDSLSLEVLP